MRGQGDRLLEIGEDRGEARDHEGEQEDNGAGPHGRDDHRIGQRRDDGLGEGGPRFQEFRQAPQRELEDAALFPRPDHVDVEAGEGSGMVLGEGVAQRAAAAHGSQKIRHDDPEARVRRQFLEDGQRAIERHAGLDQGRQLLGERQEIALPDPSRQSEA